MAIFAFCLERLAMTGRHEFPRIHQFRTSGLLVFAGAGTDAPHCPDVRIGSSGHRNMVSKNGLIKP